MIIPTYTESGYSCVDAKRIYSDVVFEWEMAMKNNKRIKQTIASVTGGEWMPDRLNKPQLHHAVCEMFGGFVSGQISRYHKVVSIKANEEE